MKTTVSRCDIRSSTGVACNNNVLSDLVGQDPVGAVPKAASCDLVFRWIVRRIRLSRCMGACFVQFGVMRYPVAKGFVVVWRGVL